MGKHKPIYDPSTDCGDYVVATNCSSLAVTGKKGAQKLYYSHSTRPGSLKSLSLDRMMEKWGGGEVLRRAVRGMLPKNRLRDIRLARLKSKFGHLRQGLWAETNVGTAFEGHAHPHKKNFLQFPNQNVESIEAIQSITEIPEVKSRISQVGKGAPAA